jgi:hypothetical protein
MSIEITTAMVSQYNSNIQILMQQKESRMGPAVRSETLVGKDGFFDQIGETAAIKRTTRHADTPQVNSPHLRRKVTGYPYDWADLIDNFDKPQLITDPTSKYVVNAVYALNRSKDAEIAPAFNATAYGGQDGTTAYAFDTTNNLIVNGSTGMTIAKLLSAKEILDGNEVDEEDRFIVMSTKEFSDLLNTTEVKSSDFNTVKALAKGELDTFLGFKFIRYQKLTVTSSVRACFAWQKNSMLLAINSDIITDVGPRRDKNMATQVYAGCMVGATRMDEKGVVQIDCYHA